MLGELRVIARRCVLLACGPGPLRRGSAGDFGTVLNAYSEIEAELSTVELKPSERARLRYALKELSGRDD
jgi:hypothetical protein